MKLHLGCGSVYLDGYINVDTGSNFHARVASLRPDLVERWITTREDYYERQGKLNLNRVNDNEFPVDVFSDLTELPFPSASVEEILTVQTLEHLTMRQVEQALSNWHRLLIPGGQLEIIVPDIERMIQLFLEADSLRARQETARLIFGTRKSGLFYHHYGYTPEGLSSLLRKCSFNVQGWAPSSINSYPSFDIVATKGLHYL